MFDLSNTVQTKRREYTELKPLPKGKSWGGKRGQVLDKKVGVSLDNLEILEVGISREEKESSKQRVLKLITERDEITREEIEKVAQTKGEAKRLIKEFLREGILVEIGDGKYKHEVRKIRREINKEEVKKKIEEIQKKISMSEKEKDEAVKQEILEYLKSIRPMVEREQEIIQKFQKEGTMYRKRAERVLEELRWEGKIKRYYKTIRTGEGKVKLVYYGISDEREREIIKKNKLQVLTYLRTLESNLVADLDDIRRGAKVTELLEETIDELGAENKISVFKMKGKKYYKVL